MFCCSIWKTRQMSRPKTTGYDGHDWACARTRTRGAACREVGVFGTAPVAAAVEEQQPQGPRGSSFLPLNNTLMNVMELTTRHDETEMAVQPTAKKKKSTAGSEIFQEGHRVSFVVPLSPVRPPDSPRRDKFKKSLATFRIDNRPDWLECLHLFYGIRNNVIRNDVEKN